MQRDIYVDNLKAILIFLVVFGHAINPFVEDSRLYKAVFDFVYSFHMPLFVFVSGVFCRKTTFADGLIRNSKTLLIPFLFFQLLYESIDFVIRGEPSSYTMNLQPYWILWYLWSLFIWKAAVSLLPARPLTIITATLFTLAYNCTVDSAVPFGINRTIGFFPIFLLGYLYGKPILDKARNLDTRLSTLVALAGLSLFYLFTDFNSPVFFHSETFAFLYHNPTTALIAQITTYTLTALFSLAILGLTPKHSNLLSTMGKNTLFIYLWHGFFIKALVISGIAGILFSKTAPAASITILFLISLCTTLLLGTSLVNRYSTIMINTFGKMLMRVKTGSTAS